MTLEIKMGNLPSKLIGVVQAEYKEETGTAVIELSNLVEVGVLEPYTDQQCDDQQRGVRVKRYFEAKDVKRWSPFDKRFAFGLYGTLLGQNGSAAFILYF